jgi:hypothetical protein
MQKGVKKEKKYPKHIEPGGLHLKVHLALLKCQNHLASLELVVLQLMKEKQTHYSCTPETEERNSE